MMRQALTESGRLRLRRPTPADAEGVFAIHGDPRTNLFNPAGPDRDRNASEARLASWLAGWEADGIGYEVVEEADTGSVVGFTGVRHADAGEWGERPEPVLNLYYRFAPSVWGRGYAAEAVRCVLRRARERRPNRPVVVITRPDNRPSLALAGRLGFAHFRDIEYGGAPSVEYRRLPAARPTAAGVSGG